jgi:hypothetical protein
MKAEDVTATLNLALKASGLDQAKGHLEKYSLEAGRSAIEVAAVSV